MKPDSPHPSPEDLFAYRDGELVAERRVIVEAHVAGCRACREAIDEVSGLEADLRSRPDDVDDRYYARLEDAVLKRVKAEDRAPRFERRKAETSRPAEARDRGAPRLPWAAVLSTASAAAAVLVVVFALVRQGHVWRAAPRPVLLEEAAPDAGVRARADSAGAGPSGRGSAAPGAKILSSAEERVAKEVDKEAEWDRRVGGIGGVAEPKDEAARQEAAPEQQEGADREPAMAKKSVMSQAAPAAPSATAPAPPQAAPLAARDPSGAYDALTRRYGLPPLWQEGSVSNEGLLRAEGELRNLYRIGGAGADSARVRFYLAEAARLRSGDRPDSAAYREIVHHYARAIRLAGADSALARAASGRLRQFLDEVSPSPASP